MKVPAGHVGNGRQWNADNTIHRAADEGSGPGDVREWGLKYEAENIGYR